MRRKLNSSKHSLGKRIRETRKEHHISLETLSRGTNLSISFLSQLERDKVTVSVENLRKIADFLDVDIIHLFEDREEPKWGVVTPKGQGVILNFEGSTAHCESLIRKSNSNIQATLYKIPPGGGRKRPLSHRGEEFVYVFKGRLIVVLDGEEYRLGTGDSLYFRCELRHSFINPGRGQSIVIVFNSPQSWLGGIDVQARESE
jgi:transcriptional regulator with XRE-family HTH domain